MGHLSLKLYVPLKPIKRGIKAWVRADAQIGILCEFSIYIGKEGNCTETDLGAEAVKKFTRSIAGHNHHIYCDNYFTSVKLFEIILQDSTYACSTFKCK